jgi:UDPglucose--hexose-1-phosphate uridylyltransferase
MSTGRIVKHTTKLADSRDLFYFDDADTRLGTERKADERALEPRPQTATMRQDVLTGEWISIASARQNRVVLPPAHLDPLAPASPGNPSEIPDQYDVAVFENRSPSFGPELAWAESPADADGGVGAHDAGGASGAIGDVSKVDNRGSAGVQGATGVQPLVSAELAGLNAIGFNRTAPSIGRCEVVCFSPESHGSFGTQTPSRARTVVEVWADRTEALSAMAGVQQVFPFENRGEAIGVTLHHPHGQIYAYPYVTPRTTRVLESIAKVGPDLFERILESERDTERTLLSGEHWTAFVPFAARWPIEVHMLPHRHIPDLAATNDAERDELAVLYLRLLRGVDALYDTPTPYIAAWHQAPVNVGREDVRLMLQVTSPRRAADKLKFLAGSETAMGAFIGDVPPEQSAGALREALARVAQAGAVSVPGSAMMAAVAHP